MHILFDKDEATPFAILTLCQAVLFCSHQEISNVPISEVAEHPLDPNRIVPILKIKLLDPLQEIVPRLWAVRFRLLKLSGCRLNQIHLLKDGLQHRLCDPSDAGPAVQSQPRRWQHVLESLHHGPALLTVSLMDAFIASKDAIDRRRLFVPVGN